MTRNLSTNPLPPDERRPTVFVSYAREDANFASRLIADLNAAGHACWIDTSAIKGGDEWMITIAEGISDSYAFVVIVTHQALESRWVRDETLWARTENKPIIPVILEDVLRDKRFFLLNDYQGVTLFDSDYDAALPKLLRALPAPAFPVTGLDQPRNMELAYLNRLRLEELLNAEKYTPMSGSSEQRQARVEMRIVFERLMGKERKEQRETRRFENTVEEIRHIRRAVLLGEPGGGKTTTLWKLAADMVETALKNQAAPIPLLIRLGRWTDADQQLPEFIASQLGDLGAYLDVLLSEKRAALLLDGLNELPASQHEAKYPQVQRFIEQNPSLLTIVSCRELDYKIDLGFDLINITPLDPIRIREFAGRYLGAEKGDKLFWKLAGQGAQDMYNRFMQELAEKFAEPDRVFWLESQLPTGVQWGWWWQDWLRLREAPSSLMVLARNPYMLLMLTSVYAEQGELPENRGELFRLFVKTLLRRERIAKDEQAPLTDGLAHIAYEMQIRRADGDAGYALTVLSKDAVSAILGERLLYLAGSANILSANEQVRFTHQLLQEYFAARYLDIEIRAGRLKATEIWLPDRWWERTNWEEAAILLAGLYSDDCTRIVEWAAQANPEVAAMCATRSGAGLADSTCEQLRSQWIPRLTDLKHDPNPKARAAVGRALGLTGWDNRKGVGIARDARGAALPDIDWVEVPGGEFQYGHKDVSYNPLQKLTLPTFHISHYPVTYAQFQTFLDDPEGYANPQWFEGLAARDDDRRMNEQYFKFANHPREMVNWYQALAFCRWFSWRLGGKYEINKVDEWAVRLPTEYEWEKAARGTDGRLYPYAGAFDVAKGNIADTDIGQTSAVGIFPNGASPFGVLDMSGNVWEWCLCDYENSSPNLQRARVWTNTSRVLRGGVWYYGDNDAKVTSRVSLLPSSHYFGIGFRIVCRMHPPSL